MGEGIPDQGSPSAQLDLERLLEISGGETEFEREIVAEYLEQTRALFQSARRALETNDAAVLRRVAHTVKGSSRTIGAEGVAALAAALEESIGDSPAGVPALLERGLACLIATEQAFQQYFASDRGREAA
jgi:HPt (histidine-containing phosphotransfer) domain-containing protein